MKALRLTLAVLVATMLASGGYVFIYLYRWQWSRALIVAVFFIAAEMALIAIVLTIRFHKLAEQLVQLVPQKEAGAPGLPAINVLPVAPAHETPPNRKWFAWLHEEQHTSVFIPILLGVGLVVSALAWLIDRTAYFVTSSSAGPQLANRLRVLAPPADLLSANTPQPQARRPWFWPAVRKAGVVVMLVLLISAGVDVLADATQTRRSAPPQGTQSQLVFEVHSKARKLPQAAAVLWQLCRYVPGIARQDISALTAISPHRYTVTVTPAIGQQDRRRIVGCLEDASIDRVSARVIRVRDNG